MCATVTRTYNPLPFQDLEPKRFEDLVRQVVYDFRVWRRLEATGRSGSDEGFDARALEINQCYEMPPIEDENEHVEALGDRLWLIQCKREKAIGPSKIAAYLKEIVLPPNEQLHGVIFAAACDFSKKTRDAFQDWCRDNGISEALIWGKGELEDMLYQPKNDNLLFAYFGISLAIRKRSQASQLRTEITTKRKLKSAVMDSSTEILIRDPSANDYPYPDSGGYPTRWRLYVPEQLTFRGLMVKIKWCPAYIDLESGQWDAANAVDEVPYHELWKADQPVEDLHRRASEIWHGLPDDKRGWLKVFGFVPYENILAIDDTREDGVFDGVQLYVQFYPECGPFDQAVPYYILSSNQGQRNDRKPELDKRIKIFPNEFRIPMITSE